MIWAPHITAAKVITVAAPAVVGAAVGTMAAPSLDWSVVVAGAIGAIISSTISGIVLIYVNRKLDVIHDTVNHLADARVEVADRAARAEGTNAGITEGLAQAKQTALEASVVGDKKDAPK